jgi:hypothetical protein
MPEKSSAFWIAVGITIFALFASAMVLVQIVRLRRAERIAAAARDTKKRSASKIPPKTILE